MKFENSSTLAFKLPLRDMPVQPRHFAIILYPPAEIADTFDTTRARFDPAYAQNIPAHITVKRPAVLPETVFMPGLVSALNTAIGLLPAFDVELHGVGSFDNPENTAVFVKVRDPRPLAALHGAVLEVLADFVPGGGADTYEGLRYHPHLTVGNNLRPEDRDLLLREMRKRTLRARYRFPANNIALLVEKPSSDSPTPVWQRVAQFAPGLYSHNPIPTL